MRSGAKLILVLILAVAFMPASSWGAIINVTTTSDSDCSDNDCDLQSALDAAADNDEDDMLDLAVGLYNSTAPFQYVTAKSYALIINGAGSALTQIDGNSYQRALFLSSNGDLTIRQVRLQYGVFSGGDGGGLYVQSLGGDVWIDDCVMTHNEAGIGGGAYIKAALNASITNSIITLNNAADEGGGAFMTGQAVYVEASEFSSNHAEPTTGAASGGGLFVSSGGLIEVKGNQFSGNEASGSPGRGGGFYSSDVSYNSLSLVDNVFENNNALSASSAMGGGAYIFRVDAVVEISGNEFRTNHSDGEAGGLYVQTYGSFGNLVVRNSVFQGNTGSGGGAAALGTELAPLDFVNNTVTDNTSNGFPGGVQFNIQSSARIYNNILWNNLNIVPAPDEQSDVLLNDVNLWSVAAEFKYNDIGIWDTQGTVTTATEGLISLDPKLVADDYHIANATSPVIDAGINTAPSIPSLDIDGDPRVIDGNGDTTEIVDMGADEYVPGTEPAIQVTDDQGTADDHAIYFGTVTVGDTPFYTVTVRNVGGDTLNIGTIVPPSSPFGISSDGCSGEALNGGETCTFNVDFSPVLPGTYNDSIDIDSNDSGGTVVVSLSGTATPVEIPDIAITNGIAPITEYDFGRVLRESPAAQFDVHVLNEGTGSLVISDVSLFAGLPYSIDADNCNGETLAEGADCIITVGFDPDTGNKEYPDKLQVSSNDPDEEENPKTLALSGHTNHPPTAPELVDTFIESNNIMFYWNESTDSDGDPIEYGVFVCEEMDFSGCEEEPVCIGTLYEPLAGGGTASEGLGRFASATLVLMALGLAMGGPRMRRGVIALLLVVLLIAGIASLVLLPGCGDEPQPGEYAYSCLAEATPTTGYWKVRAWDVIDDARYDYTDSEVRSY